ncbi:MAG: cation diffusion facilitator family transporter [Nitrospinales bacterium]
MNKASKSNPGVRVTVVGALVNIFLAITKFIAGFIGNSSAMMADAFHSLSDLLTDLIVIFTHKIGQMPKDADHPYGHGRAENIGATIIGIAILLVSVGILIDVWVVIESGVKLVPTWLAAGGAIVSILANEILFRYTQAVGEKIQSPAIVANAWHHRTDAISSIAALIGISAAMFGFPIMDPIAGAIVALLIAKAGYEILSQGVMDLMDTSLSEEDVNKIIKQVKQIPGVLQCHDLRTRRIGGKVLMDGHILVDKELSVSEGHNIAETVRRELIKSWENIEDILIHVDTEDDSDLVSIYPTSSEELKKLSDPIISSTPGVLERTNLRAHFIKGRAVLDVFVRLENSLKQEEVNQTIEKLKARLLNLEHVDSVRVYLDVNES